MVISNIRFGFAANSSSSHSVVLLNDNQEIMERRDGAPEFGRQNFVLTSPGSKHQYLAVIIRDAIQAQTSSAYLADLVVQDIFAEEGSPIDRFTSFQTGDPDFPGFDNRTHSYIDHQSMWQLPGDWDGKFNKRFATELKNYLADKRVVILGGSDESDPNPHRPSTAVNEPLTDFLKANHSHESQLIARQDGQWWVLFNRLTGAKLRFSFDSDAGKYTKSKHPELLDICITSWCPYGCRWCYQGSTEQGRHCNKSWIQSLAYNLEKMQVFEVALGGGEPTLHPDFIDIIDCFRNYNIVPNFTTKNFDFLADEKTREPAMKIAGAVAFSVTSITDARKYVKLVSEIDHGSLWGKQRKYKAHLVMGSMPLKKIVECVDILSDAAIDTLLLGFKRTGRGMEFPAHSYMGWIEALKAKIKEKNENRKYGYTYEIGVDTALAEEYQKQLSKLTGGNLMFHVQEGAYSAYIDAVNKTMGPSSYCDKSLFQSIDHNNYPDVNKVIELFDSYPGAK